MQRQRPAGSLDAPRSLTLLLEQGMTLASVRPFSDEHEEPHDEQAMMMMQGASSGRERWLAMASP